MKIGTTIRPATLADVPEILEVQRLAFSELASKFYGTHLMSEALREVPLFTASLVTEGHYFVLENPAQTLIAAGGWSCEIPAYRRAVADVAEPDAQTAIVRSVLVHPDFARRGFGRAMMEHIENSAFDAGISKLVMTATLSGMPLYDAIGYQRTDRQAAHLPSGAIVELWGMEKTLAARKNQAA